MSGPAAWQDALYKVTMASQAVLLQNLRVLRRDANGFHKVLQGESFGVPEAVVCLRNYPSEQRVMWHVAVLARGRMVMACVLPGIKLRLHDVAIDARFGIVAEVAEALPVVKSEDSNASYCAGHASKHNATHVKLLGRQGWLDRSARTLEMTGLRRAVKVDKDIHNRLSCDTEVPR